MKTESLKGAFIFILFSDALHNSPLKLPPIANDFRFFKLLYSESQINEYIARAHKMSSSKFILKYITAVMLAHWSAQKESCLDVRSFKGFNSR